MNSLQLLPALSSVERQALYDDIKANGVRVPIVKDQDGTTIDGNHRQAIAEELGVECPFTTVKFDSQEAREDYHYQVNVKRRHLSSEQLKGLAVQMRDQQVTQEKIADRLGVSQQVISLWLGNATNTMDGYGCNSLDLRRKIPKPIEEAVAKRRQAGETQQAIADDLKVTQQAVAKIEKRVASRAAKDAKKRITGESTQPTIYTEPAGRFLKRWQPKSVDLLLTDPPYMTDMKKDASIADFATGWVPVALSTVKDTGRAFIFTGSYPEELHAYLTVLRKQSRFVLDVLVWAYENAIGPEPTHGFKRNWQALFYLQGKKAPAWVGAKLSELWSVQRVSKPDGRTETALGPWEKPILLAERLIRLATNAGQQVIDPFAGSGTFLIAAANAGCLAHGSDNDPKQVKVAQKRGCHGMA